MHLARCSFTSVMYLQLGFALLFSATARAGRDDGCCDAELDRALAQAEARARSAQALAPSPAPPGADDLPAQRLAVLAGWTGNARRNRLAAWESVSSSPPTTEQAPAFWPARLANASATSASPDTRPQPRMPVFSIRQDLREAPRQLWRDTRRTFTNPVGLVLLGTAGGASAALRVHVDETIMDNYRESRTCKPSWGDAANALGSPILDAGVSLAWYYIGYQAQDYRTYSVGKTLISAYLINGASTLTLRLATNAHGPGDARYNWPSGHTSCTFTLAAVLDHSYGPVVGVPMYVFAGWVGFERIDDRQHKLSDVVFGAVLGLVVGHSVAAGHMPQIKGGYIVPYADPETDSAGFAWCKSF